MTSPDNFIGSFYQPFKEEMRPVPGELSRKQRDREHFVTNPARLGLPIPNSDENCARKIPSDVCHDLQTECNTTGKRQCSMTKRLTSKMNSSGNVVLPIQISFDVEKNIWKMQYL